MKQSCRYLLPIFCALAFVPGAFAQDISIENENLLGRPEKQRLPGDYDTQPITYRGFVIRPQLSVTTTYDDNIFREESGAATDKIISVKPALSITKEIRDHRISLNMEADRRSYLDHDEENTLAYKASLGGQISATSSLKIPFNAKISKRFIDRKSPGDSQFTAEPVGVHVADLLSGLSYRFNRLKLELLGEYSRAEFENAAARNNPGQSVFFQDRNHSTTTGTLRATYDILGRDKPEHVLFAELTHARERFENKPDENGIFTADQRDNDETGILAGLQSNYKGLLIGKIGAGYFIKDYENNTDIEKVDIFADIAWLITPKLTLFFEAGRSIDDDNSFTTGIVNTHGGTGFEYELLHNLYLAADYGITDQEFTGINSGREDDLTNIGLSLRYYHSPKWQSQLLFNYESRDSSVSGQSFDNNIFMYRLKKTF